MLADRVRMGSNNEKLITLKVYATYQWKPAYGKVIFCFLSKPINDWNDFIDNPSNYIKDIYDITNTTESNPMTIKMIPTSRIIYGYEGFVLSWGVYINGVYTSGNPISSFVGVYNGYDLLRWENTGNVNLQDNTMIRLHIVFDD